MFRITIAISSSIRPKPWSARSRFRTRAPIGSGRGGLYPTYRRTYVVPSAVFISVTGFPPFSSVIVGAPFA